MPFRKVHLDMHTSEEIVEAFSDFDARRYVEILANANVDCVAFFANCHHGNSYYNTKVGHKHCRLKGDYLGECATEARKRGMRVIAYHSICWHERAGREHPDWQQRGADGQALTNGQWPWLCMNSPHRDYMYAQMAEVASGYPVDGFFFDITYIAADGCYCDFCRGKYKATYGVAMPRPFPPEERRRHDEFRRTTRHDFLRDACAAIRRIKPDALITWNHAGDICYGAVESDELADIFMRETKHPEFEANSFHARWMRHFGKPFEPMTSVFHYPDWSGFSIKDEAKLRVEAAATVAHGGCCSFGDVGSPTGTLSAPMYEIIGRVYKDVRDMEPWLEGARSVPDVAVLFSIANMRACVDPARPGTLFRLLEGARGAHKIFSEGHRQFDVVSERALDRLEEYTTLVLAEQRYLSPEVLAAVERFVGAGGRLIVTHEAGMHDADGRRGEAFPLAGLLGVACEGAAASATSYIGDFAMIGRGVPDMPIMVRSPRVPGKSVYEKTPPVLVRPTTGRTLASLALGPACLKGESEVRHVSPYPCTQTPYAAVVHNRYGRGETIYFAHPVFSAYWRDGYTALRKLVLNALDHIRPAHTLRVEAPATVEVVANRRGREAVLHFINFHANKLGAELTFSHQTPVTIEETPPIFDVPVRWRGEATKVSMPLRNLNIAFHLAEGHTEFRVPRLDLHDIVVIEE